MSETDGHAPPPRTCPSALGGRDVLYVSLVAAISIVVLGTILIFGDRMLFGTNSLITVYPVLFISLGVCIEIGALLFAVYYVVIRRRGLSWRSIGIVNVSARQLLIWFAGGIALMVLLNIFQQSVNYISDDFFKDSLTADILAPNGFSWSGYIAAVTLAGIAAPLAEEFYFRGVVYTWMRTRWRPAVAIALNGLVFSLLHFSYSMTLTILVALMGAIFAYSFERSGNIWLPVGLHAGFNASVITGLYWTVV